MFDNHNSPLMRNLSRHLRVYVYDYCCINTAQFLLLTVRIKQIQKLSLYLLFSRGDSNVINLM